MAKNAPSRTSSSGKPVFGIAVTVGMRLALRFLDLLDAGRAARFRRRSADGRSIVVKILSPPCWIVVESRICSSWRRTSLVANPPPKSGRGRRASGAFCALSRLRLGDVSGLHHPRQRAVAGRLGRGDVLPGRRGVGARNHPRQQGALGEIELAARDAEEGVGRRLRAVEALAKINAVEVIAENLLLRVGQLDAVREEDFEELAVVGALQLADAVARELLGDRAAALPPAATDADSRQPRARCRTDRCAPCS